MPALILEQYVQERDKQGTECPNTLNLQDEFRNWNGKHRRDEHTTLSQLMREDLTMLQLKEWGASPWHECDKQTQYDTMQVFKDCADNTETANIDKTKNVRTYQYKPRTR